MTITGNVTSALSPSKGGRACQPCFDRLSTVSARGNSHR